MAELPGKALARELLAQSREESRRTPMEGIILAVAGFGRRRILSVPRRAVITGPGSTTQTSRTRPPGKWDGGVAAGGARSRLGSVPILGLQFRRAVSARECQFRLPRAKQPTANGDHRRRISVLRVRPEVC